jgi:VanZ family protein
LSGGKPGAFRLALLIALMLITWGSLAGSAPPMPGQSDKLAHFGAFLLLGGLADLAFPHTGYGWRKILPLTLYGLGIELAQAQSGTRIGSAADLIADIAGLLFYFPIAVRLHDFVYRGSN